MTSLRCEERPFPKASFLRVLLFGAVLFGAFPLSACEPSAAPADGGTAPADTAAPAGSTSTAARAVQRADSLAGRLIARTDSAFSAVDVLTAGEKRRLRRYLQDEHLAHARRLGLDPVRDRRAAADLMNSAAEENGVVCLRTNDFYIIDPRMGYAVPLLVPSAAHLLERIGRRFQRALQAQGLPPYRFILTNVLRTGRDQADLRGVNVNAAQGQSTHQYGTSFDLFYERFHYAAARDSLAGRARRSASLDDVRLQRRLRRAYRRFGDKRARKLKAVLGRALLALQREGLLLAIYERDQSVFHITVAREVEAPPAGPGGGPEGGGAAAPLMTAGIRRFYANLESQLSDLRNDLSNLGEQAKKSSGSSAHTSLADTLAALRDARGRLERKMSALVGTSPSAFQGVKSNLQAREASLQSRVERARLDALQRPTQLRSHLRTLAREMDRKINQLERQVENAGADAPAAFRQQVADLRAQLGALEDQRRALRGAAGKTFRQKRSAVADAAARLGTDLQIARARVDEALRQTERR